MFTASDRRFLSILIAWVIEPTQVSFVTDPLSVFSDLVSTIRDGCFIGQNGIIAVMVKQCNTETGILECWDDTAGLKCTRANLIQGKYGVSFHDPTDDGDVLSESCSAPSTRKSKRSRDDFVPEDPWKPSNPHRRRAQAGSSDVKCCDILKFKSRPFFENMELICDCIRYHPDLNPYNDAKHDLLMLCARLVNRYDKFLFIFYEVKF